MATKCIVCQKTKSGAGVSDDPVIVAIRRVKRSVGIAQNNRLVVCAGCMDEHVKRRARFEKRMVRYGAMGAIITVLFMFLAPSINSFLLGLFMTLMLLAFALISYWPSLADGKRAPRRRKKK
jgi:hypothetical protein